MKVRRTLTDAASMMEHRQSSGLSVQAFCEAVNITPATYYYWHKRLRANENAETPMLVPVSFRKAGQRPGTTIGNIELTYPNGVRLSLSGSCGLNRIRELILIM
jgi:transposase-like protein